MANRAEIIPALAKLFSTLPNSVDVIDRELAAAGLRTRLPRGRGAGSVSALDLTHLAFALTGRRAVREAAQEAAAISSLRLRGGQCLREEEVPRYHDRQFMDEGDLTPEAILNGHWLQRYPRDILPMAPTFGPSVAEIIERAPTHDDVLDLEVVVSWEPLRAYIRIRRGMNMYFVNFGAASELLDDRPQFTFQYPFGFLSKLSGVLHS